MPWTEVPDKWKAETLHSGGTKGPKVKKQSQMVAIMLSEKRAAEGGKTEYKAKGALRRAGHGNSNSGKA